MLLGPYGGVHFQDRLKSEFMAKKSSSENRNKQQAYLDEFHFSVSLSMYRLWLQKKDITLEELSHLIHTLYTSGTNGISK